MELSVLLTFSRLKALSTDCSLIAAAIRKSTSGLLEVMARMGSFIRLDRCYDIVYKVLVFYFVE